MSDSIKKYEEINEAMSYTGLGDFPSVEEPKITSKTTENIIFRCIIDDFELWNEQWFKYIRGIGNKPKNAEELAEELAAKYKIKLKEYDK